jgi:chromosomal replication initiation ATPase DnaA
MAKKSDNEQLVKRLQVMRKKIDAMTKDIFSRNCYSQKDIINYITYLTSDYFCVTADEMENYSNKTTNIVRSRYIRFYLIGLYTHLPNDSIGVMFNAASRSISDANKYVNNLNPRFKHDLVLIEAIAKMKDDIENKIIQNHEPKDSK